MISGVQQHLAMKGHLEEVNLYVFSPNRYELKQLRLLTGRHYSQRSGGFSSSVPWSAVLTPHPSAGLPARRPPPCYTSTA